MPLYVAGARMESMFPMSLLATGQGLNVTAVSYRGRIDFGFTADPSLVPDPWFLAEGIPLALQELRAAAERQLEKERSSVRTGSFAA